MGPTPRSGKAAAVAKKAPVKKAPVKKAPVKKVPVKKAPVKNAPVKNAPVKKVPVKKAPVKKAAVKKAPVKKALQPAVKMRPVVREDESPWTPEELAGVRGALRDERLRLLEEIEIAEAGLAELIRDSGDGAGDDQADAGNKTFEREHEMSLANNARDMLQQVDHALARLVDGSYGICEGCGRPVGKHRLQAFPRATLCLSCKEAEERW